MYTSHSRKRIMKRVKFQLHNFGGLALTLWKKCYLTTIIWHAKLAPKKHKCLIVCEYVNSHPTNPPLIYESRHKNGNLIRKSVSHTMICMPERGSANTSSQFLTTRLKMRRHLIHPKFQYSLIYQLRKCGLHQGPHRSVPHKFILKWKN